MKNMSELSLHDFKALLQNKVKRELNHIYTERPFATPKGLDLGWFCREHALHLYVLAKLMRWDACIMCGDVLVNFENEFVSTQNSGGHSWCEIQGVNPIDISLCLRYLDGLPNPALVFGTRCELSAPFEIRLEDRIDLNSIRELKKPVIVYEIQSKLKPNPVDLIVDPFSFLYAPTGGNRKLTEIYGETIFDAITCHCLKLCTGEARPVSNYLQPRPSIKKIRDWNTNSREELLQRLA